jgi:hypothetical protein
MTDLAVESKPGPGDASPDNEENYLMKQLWCA